MVNKGGPFTGPGGVVFAAPPGEYNFWLYV